MSTLGGVCDVGSTSSWKSGISEPDGGAEGPMWVDGVVRGKEQEGRRAGGHTGSSCRSPSRDAVVSVKEGSLV